MSLPVTVLTSMDPVLRDSATAAALWGRPGAVLLRYDLAPGRLHRLAATVERVLEDVRVPVEHACLGCALREDVLPTVAALARAGTAEHLVLALPAAAEPLAVLQALTHGVDGPDALADLVAVAGVVSVVHGPGLLEDLLGDELVPGADGEEGERAVGEVLAHQLDEADLVLVDGDLPARSAVLLDHVTAPGCVVADLLAVDASDVLAPRRLATPGLAAEPLRRSDLRAVRPSGARDRLGVFTLDLHTPAPLHPGRLLEEIEAVGAGRLRARGYFWVPSRPDVVCAWDGAGGQLSIGTIGTWDGRRGERPRTRLVVTGVDEGDADRVSAAFERILATPAESTAWTAPEDGLEPWLGDR
ncbi:GTP-binding protein [Kineococcus sp. NPDC059986]|uniref:GTP-binding protein n=1 Tax=Kineococcus sp. NPDC059986 TaxID=3155538 RepID=UPI0034508E94